MATNDNPQQVVFIDAGVPDIQDLLDGLAPGTQAFVIDPSSDGLQQIANILAANNLTGLTSISIVSHGESGEIELGSSLISTANLANSANALAAIGASLGSGGAIQLFGCDVALGSTGQQFINDFSALAGGVQVEAATHDIGLTASGENWALDASAGPAPAAPNVPFTAEAQAKFQGQLAGPLTAQLFFRINNGNDVELGDINVDATDRNTIYTGGGFDSSASPGGIGNETSVAVDTAAGLVFSVGIGDHGSYDAFSVHNLNTGALISTTEFGVDTGSVNTDDIVQAVAINPYTDTLYVGDWGTTLANTGVREFTYNPSNGALTPVATNGGFLFTASQISSYVNANAFYLDTTDNLLYYVNDDGGYNTSPFAATNGVYVVNLASPTSATELTSNGASAGQFPVASQPGSSIGAHGNLVGLAVDVADGIVFFESTDVANSANNALWWVSASGGANQTATKITLPAGVTFTFAGQNSEGGDAAGLTFDAETKQLYLSNADTNTPSTDAIYDLQWDNSTKTVSLVTSFSTATLVGATPAANEAPSDITLDDLPTLTTSGTATHAVEQSANVTLLTGAPTITDVDGDHLASATVQITGGTFSSNESTTADDHLTVNGVASGSSGNISWTYHTGSETLTLTGYDTLADYAALLAQVQYNTTGDNPTNYGGDTSRTITWQVNDGAVGDPSGTNTTTTTLNIDAVDDAPVNHLPAGVSGNEDTPFTISGVSITDVDADPTDQNIQVTFSVSHGTLTLNTGVAGGITAGEITAGANGSSTITVTAWQDQINTTLANATGLQYQGNLNFNTGFGAENLHIVTSDLGRTGSGGPLTDTDDLSITVNAVNDPPNLQPDTTTPVSYTENATATALFAGEAVDSPLADVDQSANYAGGSVDLQITAGTVTGDRISLTGSTFHISGGNIQDASNVNIGTITGNGTSHVTISSLTTAATPSVVDALVQSFGFDSTSDDPTNADRTVTLTFNDGGNTGSGGGLTDTVTQTVNVTAVNDAPVATITPTSYSATEQVNLSLKNNGLAVSDVDGEAGSETVTLSVTEGNLTLNAGTSGVTIDSGNGTGSVVFHGTLAQLNDLLNTNGTSTVVYNDNTDTPSASATLTLAINDNGNTGTGGNLTAQDTATINITAVNDAPVATMTTNPYTATEQTTLDLKNTGLSVSDVDSLGGSETATLSVVEGTLTVTAGTSGVTSVTGSGTNSVVITGTIAQIDALLNTDGTSAVSYIDNTDNPSASTTLTLSINDNGNTGTGGPQVGTNTSTINITAVNDAPVATITPASYSGQPNVSIDLKNTLSVSDVDGNAGSETVTLSTTPDGTLTVTAGGSGAIVSNSGTSSVTITGTVAQINNLLTTDATSTVSFLDATGGIKTLTLAIDDNGNTGGGDLTAQDTAQIILDQPPVVANAGNTVSYTEQQTSPSAILVDSAITVTDADSTTLNSATVKITGGALSGDLLAAVTTGTAITAVWNGTDTLTLTGPDTPIDFQHVLQSVTFTSSSDDPTNGGADLSRTITWTATDDLNTASSPVTSTINVTAVNDAPVAAITPTSYSATEQTSLDLKNNGLAVSDPDGNAAGVSETVTLSVASEGILNVTAGTSGAIVSNSGTNSVTITGTAANINALLNSDGTSTVSYIDNSDTPVPSVTLTLAINDNGFTGGGNLTSSDTATINITAVNDAPVLTGFGDTPSFTENGSSVVLDVNHNAAVSDAELDVSPNHYAGATLTIARNGGPNIDDLFVATGTLDLSDAGAGGNVSLDGGTTFIGTFVDNGDGSVLFTFNANATAADIGSVMRQIAYADTSDNPPSSVQIDFTFSDGNGQPGGQTQGAAGPTPGIAVGSFTVNITQVDDAPVLLNIAPTAGYTPGSPGVVLSSGLQGFDVDATPPSPNVGWASATVTIATGFLAGDQLFVDLPTSGGHFITPDTGTSNISVSSNAGGVLVLSGNDSVLAYQEVLDAVSFMSSAADPSNGGADPTRNITWQVNDGVLNSQTPSTDPNNPVNDTLLHFAAAPVVDLDTGAAGDNSVTSFTENGAPIPIGNAISVTDSDDATLSSATIVLTNAKPGDALSIVGALPAGISSSIDTSVAGQITINLSGQERRWQTTRPPSARSASSIPATIRTRPTASSPCRWRMKTRAMSRRQRFTSFRSTIRRS